MTSIRVWLTLVLILTLGLALPVAAQDTNTAVGEDALRNNKGGNFNTAVGVTALFHNDVGDGNTATGFAALSGNTDGNNNTAIGRRAGLNVTTGTDNIHIGADNFGAVADDAVIRIGTVGIQRRTFIAGIFGANALNNALPVEVGSDGQLGTVISSRRAKDDIRDMEDASAALAKLRPVTFRCKAGPATGSRSIEYGLIAEEVAEIYPELVVLDKDGQPAGVRYHVLPAMLLKELQRQQRVVEARASRLAEYDERFRDQTRLIDELTARLSRVEAKGAAAAGR